MRSRRKFWTHDRILLFLIHSWWASHYLSYILISDGSGKANAYHRTSGLGLVPGVCVCLVTWRDPAHPLIRWFIPSAFGINCSDNQVSCELGSYVHWTVLLNGRKMYLCGVPSKLRPPGRARNKLTRAWEQLDLPKGFLELYTRLIQIF